MRLNLFSRGQTPDEGAQTQSDSRPETGRTFPADEVAWGIVIRNGFDELDDPWYHRGTTQHAYLEGNDNVAICGFRPPQSGPRTRRRSRLGMPTAGEHPMCGMCARMVVAPRPRVPVSIQPARPPVAIPVVPAPVAVGVVPRAAVSVGAAATPSNGVAPPVAPGPPPVMPVAPGLPPVAPGPPPVAPVPPSVISPATAAQANGPAPATPTSGTPVTPAPPVMPDAAPQAQSSPTSPWVKRVENDSLNPEQGAGSGLMDRGVHADYEP